MRLYHTTTIPSGEAILADGFRDAVGHYLTANLYTGVWLCDRPLTQADGMWAEDDLSVLTLEIPEEVVEPFEWVEEGKPYREFLVPAATVNRYPIAEVRSVWEV
jgi:hypothetical protein